MLNGTISSALASDKQTHLGTGLTVIFGALSFEHWLALIGVVASIAFSAYSAISARREQRRRTEILQELADAMKSDRTTATNSADNVAGIMKEVS